MKKYDFLIVGAGLFGATFAYEASKKGKKCLVLDRRNNYEVEEKSINNNLNTYNEKSTEDDDEDMFSIIREYPSLTAALEDIPLQERAIATSRIASGELEIVCR